MGEAKPNNEIFRLLATELGLDAPEHHESDEDLIRGLLENEHPMLDGITWERLVDDGWAGSRSTPARAPMPTPPSRSVHSTSTLPNPRRRSS